MRSGILMERLVYNALIVHIMMLPRVNVRTSILTVKLGVCPMVTVLPVLKVMETPQLEEKQSMVNVLYTTVQIQLQTLIVRSSSLEDSVNNVLKASMKWMEDVMHYHQDVQLFKIPLVFNVNKITCWQIQVTAFCYQQIVQW